MSTIFNPKSTLTKKVFAGIIGILMLTILVILAIY